MESNNGLASMRDNDPMDSSRRLFTAVVERDYAGLLALYAENARHAVLSYIVDRVRWQYPQADEEMLRHGM
jgi:ketosteroid isomerase-like protein